MAPSVLETSWATPPLPWPACELDGQVTVSPVPSVQSLPPARTRKCVKLFVVPDASARCTIVISVSGNVTPELSAAIDASFHFFTEPVKILASVDGLSCSLSTPLTLYDTVIGAATVGK